MTDAETRPGTPSPEQKFTLTIEEVAKFYAAAGFARPITRINIARAAISNAERSRRSPAKNI